MTWKILLFLLPLAYAKLDSIDVEAIFLSKSVTDVLNDDKLMDKYLLCFLDEGPCTLFAKMIRNELPELFGSGCGVCSEEIKVAMGYINAWYLEKKPELWNRVLDKYDTNQKIRKFTPKEKVPSVFKFPDNLHI